MHRFFPNNLWSLGVIDLLLTSLVWPIRQWKAWTMFVLSNILMHLKNLKKKHSTQTGNLSLEAQHEKSHCSKSLAWSNIFARRHSFLDGALFSQNFTVIPPTADGTFQSETQRWTERLIRRHQGWKWHNITAESYDYRAISRGDWVGLLHFALNDKKVLLSYRFISSVTDKQLQH